MKSLKPKKEIEMKMNFTFYLSILLLILSNNLYAQKPDSTFKNQISFYVVQPLGFSGKVRFSVESRFHEKYALLINYTQFYGLVPGKHGYIEFRKYFKRKFEHIYYVKGGLGHSYESIGTYALLGTGTGQKIPLDKKHKFSIVCTQGIKLCPNIIGKHDTAKGGFEGLFYLAGAGAFFDVNFNLAYTF